MMSWNYRVFLTNGIYSLHEVYYTEEGKPTGYTERPATALGETVDELIADLEMMLEAAKSDKKTMTDEDFNK